MENDDNLDVILDITDQENEYRLWLTYAKMDYDCAAYLNKAPMHPRPLNIICYHCQQAAEKAAKALVVYYGSQGGMAKNHDVDFQLNQVKNLLRNDKGMAIPDEILTKAAEISMYASEPRYPSELYVDERNAEEALRDSKAIMDWVASAIDAPSRQVAESAKSKD